MKYNVIKDERYGYRRLDPIPNSEELKEFYNKKYYQVKSASDTGSLVRFAKVEADADKMKELEWLEKTEYDDFYNILIKHGNNSLKKILDIGCGTGELLQYMNNKNFNGVGIEPSEDASNKAENKGVCVHNCDFVEYHNKYFNDNDKFNAINLNNVLEHVEDPVDFISRCRNMLSEDGIIRIKVPNDFNKFQLEVQSNLNKSPWWVCIPDHINYFDFESLGNLVLSQGFEIIEKTVDFPMELFLLMEQDYLNDSQLGKKSHEMRKKFELNISSELRNEIYRSLANIDLGRNLILYAKAI